MPPKLTNWIAKARNRWPHSFQEKEIFGDGRYAVLTCAFRHPSAGQMMYSEVHLFPTEQEAVDFKAKMDASQSGQHCHAQTKGLCSRNHELIELLTMKRAQSANTSTLVETDRRSAG
jgi:hypothetical protein